MKLTQEVGIPGRRSSRITIEKGFHYFQTSFLQIRYLLKMFGCVKAKPTGNIRSLQTAVLFSFISFMSCYLHNRRDFAQASVSDARPSRDMRRDRSGRLHRPVTGCPQLRVFSRHRHEEGVCLRVRRVGRDCHHYARGQGQDVDGRTILPSGTFYSYYHNSKLFLSKTIAEHLRLQPFWLSSG